MSECSEISSEAAVLVRQWAGPRQPSDSVKTLIRRAARRLGFSYSRTKAIWYGEARAVLAGEMDALRKREKRGHAETDIEALRRRIDHLERHLAIADAAETGARPDAGGELVHQRR